MKLLQVAISLIALLAFSFPVMADEEQSVPESRWINAERLVARSALQDISVDVLVVPLQGGVNSFDPIERSLVTRLIVDRIMQSTNLLVPNPTFVFRELGSHRSTYPPEDIRSLATHVNAQEILELYANHDREGRFEFVATLVDGTDGSLKRTRTWSNLEYSDYQPPYIAIQEILGEITGFVTRKSVGVDQSRLTMKLKEFSFPSSVDELVRLQTNGTDRRFC